MSKDPERLRISNADRDRAVDRLKGALDEGRIELSEFDARSHSAYEARTLAELELIFEDLPFSPVERKDVARLDDDDEEDDDEDEGNGILHALVWTSCITIAIYLASNLVAPEPRWGAFWPAFPIGILLAIQVAGWLSGRIDRD